MRVKTEKKLLPFFFGLPSGGGGIQRKQKGKNHQMGKTLSPRGVTAPEVVCPPFFFLATGGKEKVFYSSPFLNAKWGKGVSPRDDAKNF